MAEPAPKPEAQVATTTLQFLQCLLQDVHPRNFAIELWGGTRWEPEKNQFHRFTWKIDRPDFLRNLLYSSNRQVALGEAYVRGDFDLIGDIEAVFPLVDALIGKKWNLAEKLHLASLLRGIPSREHGNVPLLSGGHLSGKLHSKQRDQQAVRYHYDVSNDFFKLWLDDNMLYSEAYFESASDDLDTAQLRRMNRICSKLCLKPGERLIDIGCGWGGLMMHAAREYRVHVIGITISPAQAELAQNRIRDAGLGDRCEVRILDYRDMGELGFCDKLVSIGMIEHVGESNMGEYFARAYDSLRPGGVFLNSGIGRAGNRPKSDERTFTDIYVFPDGDLVPIPTVLVHAEQAGFEVRSVDNLREHYARTTSYWRHRLEARAAEAKKIVGEERYRIWRLYLAGSTYYFDKARQGLYETLLAKN